MAAAASLAQGFGSLGSAASQIAGGVLSQRQGKINAKILEERGRQAFRARLSEAKKAAGTAQARSAASNGTNQSAPEIIRQIAEEGRIAALREKFAFQDAAQFEEARGEQELIRGVIGASMTILSGAERFDVGPQKTGSSTPSGRALHTFPSTGTQVSRRVPVRSNGGGF